MMMIPSIYEYDAHGCGTFEYGNIGQTYQSQRMGLIDSTRGDFPQLWNGHGRDVVFGSHGNRQCIIGAVQ